MGITQTRIDDFTKLHWEICITTDQTNRRCKTVAIAPIRADKLEHNIVIVVRAGNDSMKERIKAAELIVKALNRP